MWDIRTHNATLHNRIYQEWVLSVCPSALKTTTFSYKDIRKHFPICMCWFLSSYKGRKYFHENEQHSFGALNGKCRQIHYTNQAYHQNRLGCYQSLNVSLITEVKPEKMLSGCSCWGFWANLTIFVYVEVSVLCVDDIFGNWFTHNLQILKYKRSRKFGILPKICYICNDFLQKDRIMAR